MNDIKERMIEEDGKLHIVREQEVSAILKQNQLQREYLPSMYGDARWRKVGSIPKVMVEQWMKECGAALGSKELTEYIKKKLKDSDYKFLKIKDW